jgi:ATP-dependent exoDNAse (exonuclease V) beta subunit
VSGAGITIIGASAGSGKTHRLTQEVIGAVGASAGDDRVDLAGLVAVTFTKRAHTELEARIRHKLVEDEAYDEAMRLPLAYLGTVHAAALRLLQEFAIDAGLSPSVDVVAGNETKLLRQAFERSLDEDARRRLDELAARLELRIDHRTRRNDWVTPVADIMSLARSNRIAPSALAAMAEHSVERLLALLPPPSSEGEALDLALTRELDASIASLSTANDPRKNTADALALLRASKKLLGDGELAGRAGRSLQRWHRRSDPRFTSMASVSRLPAMVSIRACIRSFATPRTRSSTPRARGSLRTRSGSGSAVSSTTST